MHLAVTAAAVYTRDQPRAAMASSRAAPSHTAPDQENEDPFAMIRLAASRKAAKEKQRSDGHGVRSILSAAQQACAPLPSCGPSLCGSVMPCVGNRSAVRLITPRKARRQPKGLPRSGGWAACCASPSASANGMEATKLHEVSPGRVALPTEPDVIEHRVGDFPSGCVAEITDASLGATPLTGRRRLRVAEPWSPDEDDEASADGYLSLTKGDVVVLTAETESEWWSGYIEPREWIV